MSEDARRIAELEAKLKERDKQLAFQHRSLTALLAISEASAGQLTLEVVFERALRTVQDITGFNTVILRLYNPHRHCYKVMAQSGMSPEMMTSMHCAPADADHLPGEAVRRRWPAVERDLTHNPFTWDGPIPARSGYRSVVCIPLLTDNQIVGTMELASLTEYEWAESELAWLALIGRTIGSIIYRVQLTNQMRDVAAVEERARLSQEIHDGLVQTIGAIRLWSENAADSLQDGDYVSGANAITKIEAYARDAYEHLREEMLGLRNTTPPGQDIIPVLKEYINRFQRQWCIESRFTVNIGVPEKTELHLTPAVEIQLLRIIQEAMTNVRRHSCASKVTVTIERCPAGVRASIKDNGMGFSESELTGDHFGVKIMRERAASVGGQLAIETQHGQGTCVTVTIPASIETE